MNANSSRSRTIFNISVNIKESLDKEDILSIGKMHLVELTGSEDVSGSGANENYNRNACGVHKCLGKVSNINVSNNVISDSHLKF